jgi:UDP-N-acetylglucosamine transferase subunit ALG13
MIFVTVGTNEAPFCRLLGAVGEQAFNEALVVQHGPSPVHPPGAECFAFLPYPTLVEYAREARVVICHAGVGSVLVAIRAGKRPIVVPRLRRYGEAVDDHQVGFARRLHREGVVELAEDADRLSELSAREADRHAVTTFRSDLGRALGAYLRATLDAHAL